MRSAAVAPTLARKGRFALEQVPVTFAKGPDAVIITFNPKGAIAGLQACRAAGGIGEPFQQALHPEQAERAGESQRHR